MSEPPHRLQNLTELIGDSKATKRVTVTNHFNAFWNKYKDSFMNEEMKAEAANPMITDVYQLSEEFVRKYCKELFGYFADYMRTDANLMWQSNMNYISGLKSLLIAKYSELSEKLSQPWYTNLRRQITQVYFNATSASGANLQDHAVRMTDADYTALCEWLVDENNINCVRDRALLTIQWQIFGRIAEMLGLSYDHLAYVENRLLFNTYIILSAFIRTKSSTYQDLHLFIHYNNWKKCFYNALGSYIMLFPHSGNIFVTNANALTTYMNQTIQHASEDINAHPDEYHEVNAKLTSHSIRSGFTK